MNAIYVLAIIMCGSPGGINTVCGPSYPSPFKSKKDCEVVAKQYNENTISTQEGEFYKTYLIERKTAFCLPYESKETKKVIKKYKLIEQK